MCSVFRRVGLARWPARGGEAICAEALPKFRPRNAGGQRGAAIPRRAGKRRDFVAGKPPAPDESKAEHILAETPTRGPGCWILEGTRLYKKIWSPQSRPSDADMAERRKWVFLRMIYWIFPLWFAVHALPYFQGSGQAEETAVLEVYMSPVPEDGRGQWMLYVYDDPEAFPVRPDKALVRKILRLDVPQPVRIELPPGEYAVALFLDENGNGKIDRRWPGIPKEPYALSGHPRFHFGPPRFEECKIEVEAPVTVLRLHIED